ncbi:relaxase/mobilization nuclease domain-containing protein [Burkholderia pseudomallei]|uniref:relaxase/mobilization nuclease domain-containing protein n=1 Tax=Burkholderia pseudomallei TaxID=28450 RepID=UPI000E5AE7B6|nr:relaxase/mobilization nuclease domain-containing protein [Burkholderia pseudomallei]QGT03579.1 relaxase/mobilization nuclease domain-containing protein [Burkholderia pseudomallei]VUD43433.1 unnamed protein product [Burkholderia pseudomallei]
MIVKIFATGVGRGKGPINYLLSEKDHTGKTRSVKPEVLWGDPKLTRDIIDNIKNKQKYTSGVIAFRKEEKLSRKDYLNIIEEFHNYMMPLGNERINSTWVFHFDKGRPELHFVVPKIDLKTNLALNISPPGKQNQEYFRLFGAMMNERYGFSQVVPVDNDTGITMKASEHKSGTDTAKFKIDIHRRIKNEIRIGNIKNRDQLVDWLNTKSFQVVTKSSNYLTVKYDGKNVRLYGNIYSENPNFKKAADMLFDNRAREKLEWYKVERQKFFDKRYNKETHGKRSIHRNIKVHTSRRSNEPKSYNRFTTTSQRIAARLATTSKTDAEHASRPRNAITQNQNSQQSSGELLGKQTSSIKALIEQNANNSSELRENGEKNSANRLSISTTPSGSSDNSSMKVALGSRLTELLAKLVNELDPAKQTELRGQINEVKRQIADLEFQEARAKAAEEDRILRMNRIVGNYGY